MKKNVQKAGQTALHRRKLVRKVSTFAVCCIAITGGLLTFFYADVLFNKVNFPIKYFMDSHVPGLFNILVLISISIILSLSIAGLLFKKTFKQTKLSRIPDAMPEIKETYKLPDPVLEETIAPEPVIVKKEIPQPPEIEHLKHSLESEQSWNNLILSLLSINENNTAYENEALDAIASFCGSDYIGYYQHSRQTDLFERKFFRDANSTFARHSKQVEALDEKQYMWMMQQLNAGNAFALHKSDMDRLISELQDEVNEAKKWLQLQAIETFEYKLCKHEGWDYLVAVALVDSNKVKGIFLLGFQNDPASIDQEMSRRLNIVLNALGKRILHPGSSSTGSATNEHIEAILYNLSEACFTTDPNGIIQILNPAAILLGGASEKAIKGKYWSHIYQLIDQKSKQPIPDPLRKLSQTKQCLEFVDIALLTSKDTTINLEGMVAPFSFKDGETSGYIFTLRDITSRLETENELLKQHKTEAISSLSAGLAHDFNNLLTAILGNISLVLDDIPANSEQAQLLKAAEECTLKGKDITDRLLTFAKGSPPQDASSDITMLLKNIVQKMTGTKDIKVTYRINDKLPPITMSAANFEMVITNLVSNSIQAFDAAGELTITAEYKVLKETNGNLRQGEYVCIHIIDNGEGIPYNNMSRIFTPYFTTRMGYSGLGLPTVNSILVKHNGIIKIQSQPGSGTDCELYIPAKPMSGDKMTDIPASDSKADILVLDEDDMLSNLLVKTLSKLGFNVIKTTKPEELVTLYSAAAYSNNLLKLAILNLDISTEYDIPMLAQKTKQNYPDTILIAYGSHIGAEDINELNSKGFDDILLKPFNITDLKELISKRIKV